MCFSFFFFLSGSAEKKKRVDCEVGNEAYDFLEFYITAVCSAILSSLFFYLLYFFFPLPCFVLLGHRTLNADITIAGGVNR